MSRLDAELPLCLDHLDVHERDHLSRLLARKEVFGISISDNYNKALSEIAWTLKNWPKGFTVEKEELLAIAAEEDIIPDLWADSLNWFPNFLPSLNAWRNIGSSILDIEEFKDYGPQNKIADSIFEHRFNELNRLMAEVLKAYAQAEDENHFCLKEADGRTELLKRYHRYICCVCEMAREVWPNVNLEKLLKQP